MNETTDTAIESLRGQSISIHRSFADMHPLILRTSRLSLNAVISATKIGQTGAAFAIVAQELQSMARDLDKLVQEIEMVFRDIVSEVAGWVREERDMLLLDRSLRLILAFSNENGKGHGDGNIPGADVPVLAEESAMDSVALLDNSNDEPAPPTGAGHSDIALNLIRDRNNRCRNNVVIVLTRIEGLVRDIENQFDRLNMVAVRQSHFTAIAARIEAAKVDSETGDLTAVATDIRQLADDIAVTERTAKKDIGDLKSKIGKMIVPLMKEYSRDCMEVL